MFKISKSRQTVLESGLVEVTRFPRNWKIGSEQLWNLTRDQLIKMVRVMDPNFKDVRLYKSERVEEAPPGVIELPRYYAVGINKKNEWYTEDGILVGAELPSDIVERAEQKLSVHPFVAALRKNWFPVLASSILLSTVWGILTGELILPGAGVWTVLLAMAKVWARFGLAYCGLIFSFNTLLNYFAYKELRDALDEGNPPPSNPQPLPSSELV